MFLDHWSFNWPSLKDRLRWKPFSNFLENMTSWACLSLSWLKDIFQLWAHSWLLTRSLFSAADEASISCIIEKNELSMGKKPDIRIKALWKVIKTNQEKKRSYNRPLWYSSVNILSFWRLTIKNNSLIPVMQNWFRLPKCCHLFHCFWSCV